MLARWLTRWLWFRGLLVIPDWQGVWFMLDGDQVGYLWPWRRHGGHAWLSLGCEGGFASLADLRAFWAEYDAAVRR